MPTIGPASPASPPSASVISPHEFFRNKFPGSASSVTVARGPFLDGSADGLDTIFTNRKVFGANFKNQSLYISTDCVESVFTGGGARLAGRSDQHLLQLRNVMVL